MPGRIYAKDLDGLGQSLWTDLKWSWRFRACKRRRVVWRKPTESDQERWDGHHNLAGFGDALIAVAQVGKQNYYVLERFWHGWPDPPQFVFFAIAPDGTIWAAADFSEWPEPWGKMPLDPLPE